MAGIRPLEEVLELVKELVPAAQRLYPGCEVWLFGSYAKGCARPASDIDVGVLVDNLESYIADGTVAERTMDLWLAADEIDSMISACVRASDDATGFPVEIRKTGIRVA